MRGCENAPALGKKLGINKRAGASPNQSEPSGNALLVGVPAGAGEPRLQRREVEATVRAQLDETFLNKWKRGNAFQAPTKITLLTTGRGVPQKSSHQNIHIKVHQNNTKDTPNQDMINSPTGDRAPVNTRR